MTRNELERYLGKCVTIILLDNTVIEGTLHKTGEKAFENDPNLSIPVNFYFCTDNNNEVVKNTAFRVSHIQRISCYEKLRMTNFEKIKQMSINEMAQSDMEIFTCPYTLVDETYGFMCKEFNDGCTSCIKHWLESEAEE